MKRHTRSRVTRHIVLFLGVLWVSVGLVATAPIAAAPAEPEGGVAPAGPAEVNRAYEAYGFLFEQYEDHAQYGGFTDFEIDVLGAVIVAFAGLAGGPERLNALVDGPVRVRRDLQSVVSYTQAGRVIGLGRGAFDLSVTTESNYYTWGATSGDELAQIVFGHEIGHRWIASLRADAGKDWGQVYGQNVWRGERPSPREQWASVADSEEEAVTNLALYVLGKGYRWTFLRDAAATERRQVWIDGWMLDLVANSRA